MEKDIYRLIAGLAQVSSPIKVKHLLDMLRPLVDSPEVFIIKGIELGELHLTRCNHIITAEQKDKYEIVI